MILHESALVIIKKSNKFLLIKRGNPPFKGCWAAQGGHLDKGETPYQAATREAKEEIGEIKVEKKPFCVFTHDVRVGHQHKAHAFKGIVAGKIQAGTDAAEFGWFTLKGLKKLDIVDYTLRVLNKFFVPKTFNSKDREN
ncbi:MAG TPA: NUDIX domain-containing protein [archaeon]|nr:NUDIX domain-containing protein [archaeon]